MSILTEHGQPDTTGAPEVCGAPAEHTRRAPLTGDWWTRGLSLAERLDPAAPPPAALTPVSAVTGVAGAAAGACEVAAASALAANGPAGNRDERLHRWRTEHPGLLDLVAAGLGVDAGRIEAVFAEPPAALAARVPKPAWAVTAEAIAARPRAAGGPGAAIGDWRDGFAAVVRPFAAHAVTRLTASPQWHAARDLVDGERLAAAVGGHLTARMVGLAARTLVLELHVLRETGGLAGDDPHERFRSFVETMCEPAALARFADEYAVLTRLLVTVGTSCADAFAEFLGRFAADRGTLTRELFEGADPGRLAEVELGAGDGHDGGRSVLLLRFAGGQRLVYKPRPLAVHAHFNDLLDWLGRRLPEAAARPLAVLDRGRYGWLEFVAPQPCVDEAGVRRYFHRLGAQLALLYAVAGTDCHYENVIAVGDQPVLVDLESLLHVGLPQVSGSEFVDQDPAARLLRQSAARVGLLPAMVAGADGAAFDIGGLGGDAGVLGPRTSVGWQDPGTDRMRLVRVSRPAPGSKNRVFLAGRSVEPARYADDLRAGFEAGYRAVADGRGELLAPGGLVDRFADDETRLIVRATRFYSRLADESSHPDVMRDALDRDRVLGALWTHAAHDPARLALARHEVRDIWTANIPLFRTRAGSRQLTATSGAVVDGLLEESGVECARRVIGRFGEADLARQDWIIRASMATRSQTLQSSRGTRRRPDGWSAEPGDADAHDVPARALRLARRVAAELRRSAVPSGDRLCWLGLDLTDEDQWLVATLRGDLYNGYSGLGLFFAQLAHATGEQRHAELAERTLLPLVRHIEQVLAGPEPRGRTGAHGGDCGLAYALATAAVLLADDRYAAPVPGLLALVASAVETATEYDVISGAAGSLAVAEALAPRYGEAVVLAERCAEALARGATPYGEGAGWPSTSACTQPLLGFSHGAGGIGWALLRHAERTGDARARRLGHAALAYESGEFRAALGECGNWPDFRLGHVRPWSTRPVVDGVTHMHSWCHGAPGIGLARAALPAGQRDARTGQDLRRALASTQAFGLYGNHSLCHGELGNLELFTAAARIGVDGAARERERRAALVLDQIARYGPLCGTPGALATPGLMSGLAGIGHGLLRLAAPERTASVLLLEEPRAD